MADMLGTDTTIKGVGFVGDVVPSRRIDVQCPGGRVVGNLECIFTDMQVSAEKAYASVLPNNAMEFLAGAGFAALSLANNHVYDAGSVAYQTMVGELRRRLPDIQFFGTRECPFAEVALPSIRVLVIGCLEPCRSRGVSIFPMEDVLPLIRRLRNDDARAKIFVYPHWGKEGEYTRWPSPMQRMLARKWIDVGADGVIGNHSHVPQGMEWYKNKPVYYSLGNYFFDGGVDSETPESADRMVVKFNGDNWIEQFDSNEACTGFRAACSVLNNRWTMWKWARMVGPLNLKKNMASWRIRLRRSFWRTLPRFLVWQVLPMNVLFRIASLGSRR